MFHYLFPWKFAFEISVGFERGTTATLLSAAPGCGIVIASLVTSSLLIATFGTAAASRRVVIASRLSDPAALSTKTTRTIS